MNNDQNPQFVNGLHIKNADSARVGGVLVLVGHSHGKPVFEVQKPATPAPATKPTE